MNIKSIFLPISAKFVWELIYENLIRYNYSSYKLLSDGHGFATF